MTEYLPVCIGTEPAGTQWGQNAVTSASEAGICIHVGAEPLRRIQQTARHLSSQGIAKVALVEDGWDLERQWAFGQGFHSPKDPREIDWAPLDTAERAELDARHTAFQWCRKMVNQPGQDVYPEALATAAAEFLGQLAPDEIKYELVVGDDLLEHAHRGIHAVGRASNRAPVLLKLEFCPREAAGQPVEVALVGKGITFDSGGYSINLNNMVDMKSDMAGAATVTAALGLAIRRGLRKRVVLFLCCAENMISGNAYKLGDIIEYRNGVTVEIVNTDAEGRLVLADGLLCASDTGAPLIIGAGTLTGAAITAVGTEYNAVFCPNAGLRERFLRCAEDERELHWPLPLDSFHRDLCPSAFADTCNTRPPGGGSAAGASLTAGFLSRFVSGGDQGWVHLDLSAAYHSKETALTPAGATGHGIRTIARALLTQAS